LNIKLIDFYSIHILTLSQKTPTKILFFSTLFRKLCVTKKQELKCTLRVEHVKSRQEQEYHPNHDYTQKPAPDRR
jgi:hypothetical protein